MNADILIRDTNGNTLYRAEMPGISARKFTVDEAHVSDSGTLIITVELDEEVN